VPGVTGVTRRSRSTPTYATAAGYRLRSRRSRAAGRLARLASAIWESSWLTRQVLVALLVLGLVLGVMRSPWGAMAGVRREVAYYLATDLDLKGAARYVMSTNLSEKFSEGWQALPELWRRLLGREGSGGSEGSTAGPSFILPVNGTITSTYGYRSDPVTGEVTFHAGIDIAAAEGTPIVAALGGTVLVVKEDAEYGKMLEIDHGQGVMTLYAHAKDITVKAGDTVKQGDVVATVGKTGNATDPNCHFEVLVSGQPVDPLQMKGLAGKP